MIADDDAVHQPRCDQADILQGRPRRRALAIVIESPCHHRSIRLQRQRVESTRRDGSDTC
ncbi:hypothetical protein D3C86_2185480 [compost metagenome]